MTDMIKRVADAIGVADNAIIATGSIESYRRILARAAIEAMREPTEPILAAAAQTCFITMRADYNVGNWPEVWRSMIDAALTCAESTEGK